MTLQGAYAWGFVVLGIFAIVPMIEVMLLPKNAGEAAIN